MSRSNGDGNSAVASTPKDMTDNAPSPAFSKASTILIQLSAVGLLFGGFYHGFVKQTESKEFKSAVEKEPSPGLTNKHPKKRRFQPRGVTWMERQLQLDRPLSPKSAAWRALLGGTITSVVGCSVLVLSGSVLTGIYSVTEFRKRMEIVFPRFRKSVTRLFKGETKEEPPEFESEEAEMKYIASIFAQSMQEEPSESPTNACDAKPRQ